MVEYLDEQCILLDSSRYVIIINKINNALSEYW
jgi:hypothetical protein